MSTEVAGRLSTASMTVHGFIVGASNHTMLVELDAPDGVLAVYKPRDGERPLWDFPYGTLHQREVAAFEVSDHLGWDIVPPTVLRDGPHGTGSVQLFVDHDPRRHYFALLADDTHDSALMRMAAFDLIVNNADRKGGHVLEARSDGHLWGCDHGLTFHLQTKLRTVIWEFGGMALPEAWREDLRRLAHDVREDTPLAQRLVALLSPAEVAVLADRAEAVATGGLLPDVPEDDRPYPWPPI